MNVLMCVDHSDSSKKAVAFAANLLGKISGKELSITLFHVAELLPEYLLSDDPAPGLTLRDLAKAWSERSKMRGQELLAQVRQEFLQAGVPAECLREKLSTMDCLPESKKVAAALSLIEEMQNGPYNVVCIGRRGASGLGSSFIGGIAEKVIRESAGITVWLVD